jgi:hypothetical protein
MAKSENNIITHGLSGKVGDMLVFRTVNGKTIVSVPPSGHHAPTEKQKQQQSRFQEAVIYGKTVMVTPESRALYETSIEAGQSVYQVALADFMKAPDIKEVDVKNYTGAVGSTIRIRATDSFMVQSVNVTIYNADGSVVEQGTSMRLANGVDWLYTSTAANDNLDGDKIVVTASDLPGNITNSETNL